MGQSEGVSSNLVDLGGLSLDMLRRTQDQTLRHTSDFLVDTMAATPCLLQNQRAGDA